jgi:hypothetical protein
MQYNVNAATPPIGGDRPSAATIRAAGRRHGFT